MDPPARTSNCSKNVSDKALDYFQTNGTFPDGYFFWDIVHPTTQGHALVAGLALQSISGVPEPSTYAMALVGCVGGWFSIRRRRGPMRASLTSKC